jgi:hypothetical protein
MKYRVLIILFVTGATIVSYTKGKSDRIANLEKENAKIKEKLAKLEEILKGDSKGAKAWTEPNMGWEADYTNNYLYAVDNTGGTNMNVGVGTTTPNERLDVSGNLQFSGALMPGGNAGSSGQLLRSSGAGSAPTWGGLPSNVLAVYCNNSSADLCVNSSSWLNMPGCSRTLSLTAGQKVLAWAQGGIMTDSDCDGWTEYVRSIVDIRVAVNGSDFPNGAWVRTSLDYDVAYQPFTSWAVIGVYEVTSDGSYTFTLQARRSAWYTCIMGGDNTSSLQATMILMVITP